MLLQIDSSLPFPRDAVLVLRDTSTESNPHISGFIFVPVIYYPLAEIQCVSSEVSISKTFTRQYPLQYNANIYEVSKLVARKAFNAQLITNRSLRVYRLV